MDREESAAAVDRTNIYQCIKVGGMTKIPGSRPYGSELPKDK
jgi:hypothetical protein